MRRAIGLMRAAKTLCERPPPAPGGGGAPAPPPGPPAPGAPTIALSASGSTLRFVPGDPLTAAAGPLRLALTNNAAGFMHSIGVRTFPGQVGLALAPAASPGSATSLDVVLPPGSYEVYCGVDGHAAQGMVLPLSVG